MSNNGHSVWVRVKTTKWVEGREEEIKYSAAIELTDKGPKTQRIGVRSEGTFEVGHADAGRRSFIRHELEWFDKLPQGGTS